MTSVGLDGPNCTSHYCSSHSFIDKNARKPKRRKGVERISRRLGEEGEEDEVGRRKSWRGDLFRLFYRRDRPKMGRTRGEGEVGMLVERDE